MRTKALLGRLVHEYQIAVSLSHSIESVEAIMSYLTIQSLDSGVCYLCRKRFGIEVSDSYWVNRNQAPNRIFWADTPRIAQSRPDKIAEIRKALALRHDILKKEYECRKKWGILARWVTP